MAVINTNILALGAQNNLAASQSQLGTSIERLSSGLRINSAKDDAAGMAISTRFTSNIEGLNQASRNANDGISIAQTTESALNQITDNLGRIRELSVQAANGSNSDKDLASIQQEIDQRLEEINRVSEQTQFNGLKVLDDGESLTVQVGANDSETITIDLKQLNQDTLGLDNFTVENMLTTKEAKINSDGEVSVAIDFESSALQAGGSGSATTTKALVEDANGDLYVETTTTPASGSPSVAYAEATVGLDGKVTAGSTASPTAVTEFTGSNANVAVDIDGLSSGETFVAGSDGNFYIENEDGSLNEVTLGSSNAVTAGDAADIGDANLNPLSKLDKALDDVSTLRSEMGAIQNRFEAVIGNLDSTSTNLASAQSRIQDADYAEEVSSMTRAQILQQAGTAVLAQANQVPQTMLSLLS